MARVAPLSKIELSAQEGEIKRIEQMRGHPLNNCYRTMARKPNILRAVTDLSIAVMREPGGTPTSLRWMVAHVASNAAGCRYCTAHTARNAATRGDVSDEKIAAIWQYQTSPLFSEAERAALDLALAAGSCPPTVDEDHFIRLRQHYSEDQIVEIVAAIAMFGWFNRWNDTMGSDLEEEALSFKHNHPVASGWALDQGIKG
jgi:uncharacterized peroxidase-related enzyme